MERLNNVYIVLLPKVPGAELIGGFRPIVLSNSIYLIIAKVLANHFQEVLDRLISPLQSAFIPGRQMIDSIVMAEEIVAAWRRSSTSGFLWKVDFAMGPCPGHVMAHRISQAPEFLIYFPEKFYEPSHGPGRGPSSVHKIQKEQAINYSESKLDPPNSSRKFHDTEGFPFCEKETPIRTEINRSLFMGTEKPQYGLKVNDWLTEKVNF